MQLRTLGKSSLKVSLVGLGCSNFGRTLDIHATRSIVHRALDLGINFFDTANTYGNIRGQATHPGTMGNFGASEVQLGEIFASRRKDVVIATKFGDEGGPDPGGSRRNIVNALEGSLRRLRTDYIDFYQLHEPDPKTPIEETLRALDDLVRDGKVRAVGCCNLKPVDLVTSLAIARSLGCVRFETGQYKYNMIWRELESDIIPLLEQNDMSLIPYYPLAGSLLTGRYKGGDAMSSDSRFSMIRHLREQFQNETNWILIERLTAFCDARGWALPELAMAWLAAKPFVGSIIAGASRPEQVEKNVKALNMKLSSADLAAVDEITARRSA